MSKETILLSGFPKSGTTWVCQIFDRVLEDKYFISKQISPNLKRVYRKKNHQLNIFFSYLNNPLYNTDLSVPNNSRCILIYRNFKNILVSCYFQQKYRELLSYNKDLVDFIDFKYGGINSIIKFYNLIEEQCKHIEYLYYENMLDSLMRLSVFENYDKNLIIDAYNKCNFEQMRKQEINNYYNQNLTLADKIELCPKNIENVNSFKTRAGPNSNYTEYLNPKQIEKINTIIKNNFKYLNKHQSVI